MSKSVKELTYFESNLVLDLLSAIASLGCYLTGCFSTKVNIARDLYIISKRTILSPAPAANNESSEVFDIIKPGRKIKI